MVQQSDSGKTGELQFGSGPDVRLYDVKIEAINNELILFTRKGSAKLEMEPLVSVTAWTPDYRQKSEPAENMQAKDLASPYYLGATKIQQKLGAAASQKNVRRHLADRHSVSIDWLNSEQGDVENSLNFHRTIDHTNLSHAHESAFSNELPEVSDSIVEPEYDELPEASDSIVEPEY